MGRKRERITLRDVVPSTIAAAGVVVAAVVGQLLANYLDETRRDERLERQAAPSDDATKLKAADPDAAKLRDKGGVIELPGHGDFTPPTVSIIAPAPGFTLSGTITLAAAASDNLGVVGVQFRLDGANLGAENTTNPYSVAWNTITVPNGPHTLTALARDAVGNLSVSAATAVTVANDLR